jgi:hypothetical protein
MAREADGVVPQNGDDEADEENPDESNSSTGKSAPKKGPVRIEIAESVKESDVRKAYPSIYAQALREATAAVAANTKETVESLRKKLAEANARIEMRESLDTAKSKLIESALPASAATRLLPQLLGKSEAEMSQLIEAEVSYLSEIGVTPAKKVAGNGNKVTVRESQSNDITSAILAGMGG